MGMKRFRTHVALGALGVLAALTTLAGCGGDNGPPRESPPSPWPTTSVVAGSSAGASTAPSQAPGASPSAGNGPGGAAAGPLVVLQKTGGLAGVRDTVTITDDGTWTHTDKSDKATSGHLTADQLSRLKSLAADPRLAQEATAPTSRSNCADAFVYSLTVGATRIGYSDCPGDAKPPATAALIALLSTALQ
jgi:predicted small lipoprotein YifL